MPPSVVVLKVSAGSPSLRKPPSMVTPLLPASVVSGVAASIVRVVAVAAVTCQNPLLLAEPATRM